MLRNIARARACACVCETTCVCARLRLRACAYAYSCGALVRHASAFGGGTASTIRRLLVFSPSPCMGMSSATLHSPSTRNLTSYVPGRSMSSHVKRHLMSAASCSGLLISSPCVQLSKEPITRTSVPQPSYCTITGRGSIASAPSSLLSSLSATESRRVDMWSRAAGVPASAVASPSPAASAADSSDAFSAVPIAASARISVSSDASALASSSSARRALCSSRLRWRLYWLASLRRLAPASFTARTSSATVPRADAGPSPPLSLPLSLSAVVP
mmetsp:Transcript_11046/g.45858  ORF Transcript_11046/g.45858 Transcript_11046/m.45858 type:complete len:273 (+) Transcript_11046:206-1024(+)